MNTSAENRLRATSIDSIVGRALQFARTFDFINYSIVCSKAARTEFVERYGTPDSSEYREVEIHMEWGADRRELINSSKIEERNNIESLLSAGVDLLVVCSSTDIIYHEFLRMDLD